MKSFVLALIVYLFLNVTIIVAQTPTLVPTSQPILTQMPIVGNKPIPGQTCGTLKAPNNRCCYFKIENAVNLPSTNNPVIDTAFSLVSTLIDKIIKPIFNPLSQMAQNVVQPCIDGAPSTPGDLSSASCVCVQATLPSLSSLSSLCKGVSAGEQGECNKCLNEGGVWTAATCIYASVQSFIEKTLLGWGIGLAGIVSLLCIIYAAFMIQTSQGSPEKIKKAQELLTSCIMGLMLIIFSIFILKLIGVDILRIPGFNN